MIPTKEISEICPPECSCLLKNDKTTAVFDCSSSHLKCVPSAFGGKTQHLSALNEFDLNIENNEIQSLPNPKTMRGFELIIKDHWQKTI